MMDLIPGRLYYFSSFPKDRSGGFWDLYSKDGVLTIIPEPIMFLEKRRWKRYLIGSISNEESNEYVFLYGKEVINRPCQERYANSFLSCFTLVE